jgi:hypothetical protein
VGRAACVDFSDCYLTRAVAMLMKPVASMMGLGDEANVLQSGRSRTGDTLLNRHTKTKENSR